MILLTLEARTTIAKSAAALWISDHHVDKEANEDQSNQRYRAEYLDPDPAITEEGGGEHHQESGEGCHGRIRFVSCAIDITRGLYATACVEWANVRSAWFWL